jgi:hypothetical protein
MLIVEATLRDHNPGTWLGAVKSGEIHFMIKVGNGINMTQYQYAVMVQNVQPAEWNILAQECKDFASNQNTSTAKLLLAHAKAKLQNDYSMDGQQLKGFIDQFLTGQVPAVPGMATANPIAVTYNGQPTIDNKYVTANRQAGWSPQSRLAEPRPTLSAWAIMQLVLSLAPSMLVDPSAGTIHEINDLYFAIRQWLRDHPEVDANPHTPTTDELTGIKAKLAASLSKGADA